MELFFIVKILKFARNFVSVVKKWYLNLKFLERENCSSFAMDNLSVANMWISTMELHFQANFYIFATKLIQS